MKNIKKVVLKTFYFKVNKKHNFRILIEVSTVIGYNHLEGSELSELKLNLLCPTFALRSFNNLCP